MKSWSLKIVFIVSACILHSTIFGSIITNYTSKFNSLKNNVARAQKAIQDHQGALAKKNQLEARQRELEVMIKNLYDEADFIQRYNLHDSTINLGYLKNLENELTQVKKELADLSENSTDNHLD